MSDKPVNLNQVRKARSRDEAKRQADANAIKYGRTKAARDAETREAARATKRLDGHGRDT